MGFDDFMFRRLENAHKNRESLPASITKAHSMFEDFFRNPRFSIQENEDGFVEQYGHEAIVADEQETRRLDQAFASTSPDTYAENTKKTGDVLEGSILVNGEFSGWLGNATVLKTARYDDYKNGSDLLAELHDPLGDSRVLGLSVDVTFGPASVDKKFQEIHKRILANTAGTIKYSRSKDKTNYGPRLRVPQVVVGISQRVVEHIATLTLRLREPRLRDEARSELVAHPFQRALLEQIYAQLQAGVASAHRHGKDIAAAAYAEPIEMVAKLRHEKSRIPLQELAEDSVHMAIMKNAQIVRR